MQDTLPISLPRRFYSLGGALAFAFLVLGALTITRFGFLGDGLDPSWAATLVERTAAGASQGRDLIFTGGPLSILYTRYFHPNLAPIAVFFSVVVVLAFAQAAYLMFRDGRPFFASVLLFVPMLGPIAHTDTAYFALPLLFAAARLQSPRRGGLASSLLFCLAAAGLVAAKFSVLPMVLLCALILDIDAIRRRQVFSHVLCIPILLFVIFIVTGSRLADFPLYLAMSLDTSSGYAEAMSLDGNWQQLALFLGGAIVLAVVIIASTIRGLRKGSSPFVEISLLLMFGGYMFLCFKAGFVRFDMHQLAGWAGLCWATSLFIAVRWPTAITGPSPRMAALAIIPLAVSFGGALLALKPENIPPSTPLQRIEAGTREVQSIYAAVLSPQTWWHNLEQGREQALAAVRAAHPMPHFEGGVDVIASEQAELIASGELFLPRPTVQEYTTYSSATIAANRTFFESDRAPANLLLKPISIDGRYPAMAEGPLWPLFFQRYEVKGEVDDNIWMVRRQTPLPDLLGPPTQMGTRLNATLQLEPTSPIFVRIDVQKNWLGKIAAIAFRPPILQFVVTASDGSRSSYRLIPAIAREGFLLSPVVGTTAALKLLLNAKWTRDPMPKVTSISVVAEGIGAYFYRPDISVSVQPFEIPDAPKGAFPKFAQVADLAAANPMKPPMLSVSEEGVFAHAPAMLTLPTTGAQRLNLGFGLRPVRKQMVTKPDGVCFRVLPAEGDAPLFERCLSPTDEPADAGPQTAQLALPAGTSSVRLETTCRANCSYDWSYWSRAILE
ncbi:hypothetical protein [Aquabacter cavernae]|uniref:hypothetical protein n=1 Tax=Aquabacter cavernae TaxID=2496029 RepID=UPI000F8D2165|nr:hypothetical protein [Aquabacter cavernae]